MNWLLTFFKTPDDKKQEMKYVLKSSDGVLIEILKGELAQMKTLQNMLQNLQELNGTFETSATPIPIIYSSYHINKVQPKTCRVLIWKQILQWMKLENPSNIDEAVFIEIFSGESLSNLITMIEASHYLSIEKLTTSLSEYVAKALLPMSLTGIQQFIGSRDTLTELQLSEVFQLFTSNLRPHIFP